ncbi:MAG: hypothetical protein WC497_02030 [Patescibacteria group bacterium]
MAKPIAKNNDGQSKKSLPALWFLLTIIVAAGLVIGAYFYTQCDTDKGTSTTLNSGNNTNANANVNANANTNSLTNANANLNANTNTNVVIPVSNMRTITYQLYNHGFEISVPSDWTGGPVTQGINEEDSLVSVDAPAGYIFPMWITYYNNGDPSFEVWLNKKLAAMRSERQGDSYGEIETRDNGMKSFIRTTPNNTDVNLAYQVAYGYIARGQRVYQITLNAPQTVLEKNTALVNDILDSFAFIDPKPYTEIINPTAKAKVANEGSDLSVSWLTAPVELNLIENAKNPGDQYGDYFSSRQYYQVGTINTRPYAGQALVVILELPMGPAFQKNLYRVAYNPDTASFVYLEKYSDDLQQVGFPFQYDTQATLSGFTVPAEIAIPDSSTKLLATAFDPNKMYTDYSTLEKKFTNATVGDVSFDTNEKCFIVRQKDGTAKKYIYKLDFATSTPTAENPYFGATSFRPDVRWNDGTRISEDYTYNDPTGGCGTMFCHALTTLADLGGQSALVATGRTSTGDAVYEFADKNNPALKEVYDSFYVPIEETKPSYDAFAADHPVFFWQDPFGMWLRFKKATYVPAAECGKPVIYLYPEKETPVNVKVSPTGGFTLTEPAYPADGWAVIARPDGQLKTANGDEYPYLFWEGVGLNYEIPNRGFVIARSEVGQFLKEKLVILGLNEKESAEFIEFWQPKLEIKPYVFVTFINQAVFDQLAPLTVIPKPDQVIRVFMDYKPLDTRITVTPQKLETPVRHGFTVVEWGGALHR